MEHVTLTVGGSFTIGDSNAGPSDLGRVSNEGTSTFSVGHNFTIHGDGGSYVYNGVSATEAAVNPHAPTIWHEAANTILVGTTVEHAADTARILSTGAQVRRNDFHRERRLRARR